MIQINRYRLANGLRVVHNEDDSTQMVALNILYDVGSFVRASDVWWFGKYSGL